VIRTLAQDIRVIEDFGGTAWTNHTHIHPLGLALTILSGLALLAVPRRFSLWPFILMACVVAPAQRLVVAGLDFNLVRILVVFGFIRVVTRSEYRGVRWLGVDAVVLAFALVRTAAYTILHADAAAFIFQAGQTFDAVGLYFLFRCLVREPRDVVRAATGFVIMSVPVAIAFLIENKTGRNAFAFFGGVPEITMIREDRMRCQGAFAHPIIAGCFWAGVLPMVAALWWQEGASKLLAALGVFTCGVIVLFTASSTPVMGVLFGMLGGAMFFVRWWMRYILMGVLVLMILLHFSMKAPIWHLISRITIAKGNTGYHRFQLIDNAIHRFGEWALFGTKSTAHWFWGGQDVTNHYLLEAVRGGFLTLALFLATIWMCFVYAGKTWRAAGPDRPNVVLAWSLGVCLFVHCTNFIGVSYFGQGVFLWYMQLAMIVSIWEGARRVAARRALVARAAAPRPPQTAPIWSLPAMSGAKGPGALGSERA
jgi:hypothetical protein